MIQFISYDDFMSKYEDEIYERYCDLYPEEINSDWTLEDANDTSLEDLVSIIWMEHIAETLKEEIPKDFLSLLYPGRDF